MGQRGEYLDSAVRRSPVGAGGRSGAALERVLLADGRRLIVKRFCAAEDMLMSLTGDDIGREYLVWSRGILDELPPSVTHAVIDGWLEGDAAVIVMRDLGDTVLDWSRRLSRADCRLVIESMASMHRAFLERAPADLTPLPLSLTMFAPHRMRLYAGGPSPMPDVVIRGWDAFEDLVPDEISAAVFGLLADPQPVVSALQSRPCTLIHGDPTIVNMAICDGQLTLIDWTIPAAAPAALDVALMLVSSASAMEMSREEVLSEFVRCAGPAVDQPAIRLALLAGLMTLGWNKALDVTEHPDEGARQREWDDLDWWVREARVTLDAGLL